MRVDIKKIFVAFMLILPVTGMALTTGNGCDDEETNDRINPVIALCSTHAYNAGLSQNPSSSADREQIRDIVALKTTIVTQQMKKQYDYLESTVQRLKTQMRKAVLKSQLQAAGAAAEESQESSFKQTNRSIYMAGITQDCNSILDMETQFTCLQEHYTTLYNQSNNARTVTTEMKKQMVEDYKVSCDAYKSVKGKTDEYDNCEGTKYDKCTSDKPIKIKNNADFAECLTNLRKILTDTKIELDAQKAKNKKEKD